MLSPQELDHLANLARIDLNAEQKDSLLKEFDSILGYIDQLKKVQITDDASARVGAVRNVMREDEVRKETPESASIREELLDEAPHREGDFIAVKKIIAQDI